MLQRPRPSSRLAQYIKNQSKNIDSVGFVQLWLHPGRFWKALRELCRTAVLILSEQYVLRASRNPNSG